MILPLLLCLGAALASSDAECDEESPGLYMFQMDKRAVKAGLHAQPKAPQLSEVEGMDLDVALLEKQLKRAVPWIFQIPRPQLVETVFAPVVSATSDGTARVRMNHGGIPASSRWKVCLSAPIILLGCYLLVTSLKSSFRKGHAPHKVHAPTLYVTCLITMSGSTMISTLKPFIAVDFGASPDMVGLLQSASLLTAFMAQPAMGWLGDRVGRRRLLLVLPVGHILSHLGCAMSSSYLPFLIFRLCQGCFGAIIPICEALVTEGVEKEERAGAIGKLMAALGLGVVMGPGLAALLAPLGTSFVFLVASCISTVNWSWILWNFDFSEPGALPAGEQKLTQGAAEAAPDAGPVQVGMLMFWYGVCLVASLGLQLGASMLPLTFLESYGIQEQEMGIMYMVAGVVMIVAQGTLTGVVSKTFGNPGSIIIGNTGVIGVCLLLINFHTPALPWIVVISMTSVMIFMDPQSCAAVSNLANDSNRGMLMGIYQSLRSFGMGVGPYFGGVLYEHSTVLPFIASICSSTLLIVACATMLLLTRCQRAAEKSYKDTDTHEDKMAKEQASS